MKVRRYFILIHFAVKNIPNKNILEFTYIDIKISFIRGYVDISKRTIFENWFGDNLAKKSICRKR